MIRKRDIDVRAYPQGINMLELLAKFPAKYDDGMMQCKAEKIKGYFEEAKAWYEQLDFHVFKDILLEATFDNLHESNYLFVYYLLKHNEKPNLHDLVYLLMSQPLCHTERAYFIAYNHAKRAAALTDYADTALLENIIFLHGVPDQMVSDAEAEKVARKFLAIDSRNEIAKQWLKERK